MKVHPVARLFPPMAEVQYAALRDDIRENGQREPVTIWRDQVIDGVHRMRACDDLGRATATRTWDGEEKDLTAYVVSLNLHRRHMDESQRAMVAARIAPKNFQEGIAVRNRSLGYSTSSSIEPDVSGKVSTQKAARLFRVGVATVKRAQEVRNNGVPELVEAVERGDLPVHPASEIAKLSAPEQRAALAEPRPRRHNQHTNRNPVRAAGERIHRTVETMTNLAEVLAEAVPQMNGDKRRADWASSLRGVRTTITRFIVECEK